MCKFTLTMLEGTRALLAAHRRELPQRDDLCGAFCTALALRAAAFEPAAALSRPVTLVANIATRHLWGSRASAEQLLAYLLEGELDGPDPDWDVGHFVCVVGRVEGPAGSLYVVADTYPSLG